ncbi:MAG: UDP-N-acetylmuramate--L-alanine ligase [Candidatus Omnitrophica bacterium]|nr:UDP-N-acetylmuramate--L-alanine ligase [Candidatus Omnitrophota bacterium]
MKSKHYHFIGIGGMGMGTLALLLLAKGHKISGSDLKDNELIAQLCKNGATVAMGHQASNIQNPDYVVYSSAIPINNPERIESVSRQLSLLKRAQVLAQLVNEQVGITIAGAHGKTTTTSMVSYLLLNAGLKPTTAIGGIINGHTYNAHLGEGKYFVAETDESDGTFLYFRPRYSIITNIDFEHVDFYKDWQGILEAYRKFINCTVEGGCVIACSEDQRLKILVKESKKQAVFYGFDHTCDVWAKNIITDGFHSQFECHTKTAKLADFELMVPGRHNVLNALACIALGLQLGVSVEMMQKTLKEFSGVKRRFQLKCQMEDIMVVDDYGHHPTEIVATLQAARLFHKKRLVTVFQPHRYSRTKFLLNEFAHSLALTDWLIITDIYAASEKPSAGVGIKTLLETLQKAMGNRVVYLKKEEILNHLADFVQNGDLVLFLGAGDIYHCCDELVNILNKKKVMV